MIKRHSILIAVIFIGLTMLSCRPVFAIGWTELLILVIIIAFLMGPFLLRVYRAYDRLRKTDKAVGKKK